MKRYYTLLIISLSIALTVLTYPYTNNIQIGQITLSRTLIISTAITPLIIYAFLSIRCMAKNANYLKENDSIKLLLFYLALISIHWIIVFRVLGLSSDIGVLLTVLVAVITMIMGIAMLRLKQNYVFGLKTPWTLADENIWIRSNKVCGYGYILSGTIILLTVSLNVIFRLLISLALIIGTTFYSVFYSYKEFKRTK